MTFATYDHNLQRNQKTCLSSKLQIEILFFHSRSLFVTHIVLRTIMAPTREIKKDMFAMFHTGLYIPRSQCS